MGVFDGSPVWVCSVARSNELVLLAVCVGGEERSLLRVGTCGEASKLWKASSICS
jgi:hypothetical protein